MRVLTVFLLAAALVASGPALMAVTKQVGGGMEVDASEVKVFASGKLVLTGNAYVKTVDKVTGAVFEARAPRITFTTFGDPTRKGGPTGIAAVKDAQFTGPVQMTYTKLKEVIDESGQKATVVTQTDANADSASYDGTKQMAYLTGNVTMSLTDPSMYSEPAIATGQSVEVNMKPRPGPEDLVFRISTPGGVSHFEATPLPKEETKSK